MELKDPGKWFDMDRHKGSISIVNNQNAMKYMSISLMILIVTLWSKKFKLRINTKIILKNTYLIIKTYWEVGIRYKIRSLGRKIWRIFFVKFRKILINYFINVYVKRWPFIYS